MKIYISCSDQKFNRDLQLLKMFRFEKVDSFHPKTVTSYLKEEDELECKPSIFAVYRQIRWLKMKP